MARTASGGRRDREDLGRLGEMRISMGSPADGWTVSKKSAPAEKSPELVRTGGGNSHVMLRDPPNRSPVRVLIEFFGDIHLNRWYFIYSLEAGLRCSTLLPPLLPPDVSFFSSSLSPPLLTFHIPRYQS